jgi:hypothetical protein
MYLSFFRLRVSGCAAFRRAFFYDLGIEVDCILGSGEGIQNKETLSSKYRIFLCYWSRFSSECARMVAGDVIRRVDTAVPSLTACI